MAQIKQVKPSPKNIVIQKKNLSEDAYKWIKSEGIKNKRKPGIEATVLLEQLYAKSQIK